MKKIVRSTKFISQILVICLTLFTLVGCERGTIHSDDLLTPGEREWLSQHDGKITLAMETNYAPFAFVDKNRRNTGLATDYIQLIQKKLNFKSNEIRFDSLNKIMESARTSKIDIVNAVTETPNRSRYLLFTKPFIEIPNVIIVRKERKESITVNQLKEMKVSLIKDYAVTESFLENHDPMNVDLVPDVLTALLNVSLNQTNAAILDMATASYLIQQKGITNLRVAGDAGHSIKLAIGSRKDWPVLNQILNKGLAAISEQEHKSIRDKWVNFNHIHLFKSGMFWMVIIVICIVFFLCIVTILLWNKTLKRQVEQRTRQLSSELRGRKKIEEALRESEMRFSLAMQASQDGLFDWNIITDKIYYSPGWKRLLGYEDHEIKNEFSAWEQLTDPENVKESWTVLNEVFEGKRDRFEIEFKMRHKKGHWVDILSRAKVVFNEDGKGKRLIGTHVDITTRKNAEIALQESEEKLSAMFEHMSSGVAVYQPVNDGEDFVFTKFNSAAEKITHLKREDVLGRRLLELFPHMDKTSLFRTLQQVLATGEAVHLKPFFYKDHNREGWRENKVYRLPSREVVALFDDVTQRMVSESIIKESEKRYRTLFHESNDGIIVHDFNGQIIDANHKIKRMLGYHGDELIPLKILSLHPDSQMEISKKCFQEVKDAGHTRFETQMLRRDGSAVDVEISSSTVDLESSIIQGIIRDLTKRKEMEQQVRQAQKMESIGNLAGGIAHDFNNILFPIIGMSELLLENFVSGTPEYDNVHEIFNAGKRGGELVKQILSFSRQDENKRTPIGIQRVLTEALKLMRSTIPSDIKIQQDIQPDCNMIEANATRIHQVVMNLITNAYHAVETTGGEIHVKLFEKYCDSGTLNGTQLKAGPYVVFRVSDNGCGIDPLAMEKIFEPYFTTKKKGKGTGLGLSVVYGIAREHQGDITVESKVDKGTTFNLFFPVVAKEVVPELPAKTQLVQTGSERILLVDDEISIVRLEKQILERLGYQVAERTSSIDALNTFKETPFLFDLVISDMTMPYMTGDQLALKISEIRPDMPIIICTGFSEKMNKIKMNTPYIKEILMKPVGISDLANAVRNVLDAVKKTTS